MIVDDIIPASGKTGLGVKDVLRAIIDRVPAPKGDPAAPLQALIFDSVFNSFRGIIAYVRVKNGTLKKGEKLYVGYRHYQLYNLPNFHQEEEIPFFQEIDKVLIEWLYPGEMMGRVSFPIES